MKRHLHILYIFFVVGTMSSQEKQIELSMNEAIDYALKNSYDNRVANKNIDAAKQKKWETTTIGLPQIDAKVDYINNLKQQFPGIDFNQDGIVDFGAKQSITGTATLRQLLFDGSYLVGLQSAKTYLQISKQAKQKTELGTREAVINAYGNVLVTEKSIEILLRNKKVNDGLLRETKLAFDNGLAEEEQVEQFEITKGNIDNNIRSSNRLKIIAYKMLNITLGNDINTKLILTDDLDSLVLSNTDLSLVSHDFNLKSHIDFKIAQNDRESKRLLMRLEQSKALPSLSAFVNYSQVANSDSFTFFNASQSWIPTSVFGVSLNVPIFSSFKRRSKTKQAKIALETADIRLEEIKLKLKLQAENAKSDYQLSIDTYQTAKRNLNLSERIEKKQQIKFNEGITTSFDLLQAQNQLYTQQNNYIQSMLNIIASKATLENALNIPIK
ncbi:TolC family protein [Tenacibaculum ovolyticum]|uniref:TolC family protein n=1 Tax=Tenacibaculum ovolyticum TaxID=104270 RepID=UPI0022F3E23C|nr:TolC family protein [Tenacibaculum ovolyticum]WBX77073.1 TolC family protein [Tenacibaculum ovolyticum]